MIHDLPVILIALICISPTLVLFSLLYIVLAETEIRRKDAQVKLQDRNP